MAEYTRNPQTESLLQFLELPYLLDNTSESSQVPRSPLPLIRTGNNFFFSVLVTNFLFYAFLKLISKLSVGSLEDNSEDIPIDDVDDVDELEELAEDAVDTKTENI